MDRRAFIGTLCAVLTAPLWGKKAAEPAEEIVIDPKAVRRLLASRGLVVDRIEEIPYTKRERVARFGKIHEWGEIGNIPY